MNTQPMPSDDYDIIIAGGGPVGLVAALAFARKGWRVLVVEKNLQAALAEPPFDGREIVFTRASEALLRDHGIWDALPAEAVCPLMGARAQTMDRDEQPVSISLGDPLARVVPNYLLRKTLYQLVEKNDHITLFCQTMVAGYESSAQGVEVSLSDGQPAGGHSVRGKLLVGADGPYSFLRNMAGIKASQHDPGLGFFICRVRHDVSHENLTLQWYKDYSSILLLPVASDGRGGYISSFGIGLPPEEIARLKEIPDAELNMELTERIKGFLGPLEVISQRCGQQETLNLFYAHQFCAERFALLGDAAVCMHPTTGQGFNFGLRGAALLAEKIPSAGDGEADPGGRASLEEFEKELRIATYSLYSLATMPVFSSFQTELFWHSGCW